MTGVLLRAVAKQVGGYAAEISLRTLQSQRTGSSKSRHSAEDILKQVARLFPARSPARKRPQKPGRFFTIKSVQADFLTRSPGFRDLLLTGLGSGANTAVHRLNKRGAYTEEATASLQPILETIFHARLPSSKRAGKAGC
jgi:hypothetical protein